MKSGICTIRNGHGIHVRPSGVIISETAGISSSINLKAKGMEFALQSVMDLLALGLEQGDEVVVSVEGPDEDSALIKVTELFERVYDFPPRE